MTKLEKKLIELGYEVNSIQYISNKPYMIIYEKRFDNICHIEVHYIYHNEKWSIHFYIDVNGPFAKFEIDRINNTFNEKQKDLEVLRSVESNATN